MKKPIIGSIVGAVIIFLWQFLSWAATEMHGKAQQYTPKQDSILAYLNTQFSEDGQYIMPRVPPGASMDECEKMAKASEGKPWAVVSYHKAMNTNMTSGMARGLIVNIVMVWLACWIFSKMAMPSFGTIFLSCIFIGLIIFINIPYTMHIWYQTRDIYASLADALASWGLTGLWLGWWLRRK